MLTKSHVDITNCPRCFGDHGGLDLHEFTRPAGAYGQRHALWTHFVLCPKTGEPALVKVRIELEETGET